MVNFLMVTESHLCKMEKFCKSHSNVNILGTTLCFVFFTIGKKVVEDINVGS